MTVELMRRARVIFERSLDYEDGERRRFVAEACEGDAVLRRAVERLLENDALHGDLLAEPLVHPRRADLAEMLGSPNEERIAGYEILGKIGCGGMSRVYLAESLAAGEERRRVAVKVVTRDLEDPVLAQRVRVEREVLGALDHPNIARLLDAGTTSGGRPYFVLEYVDGLPITEHCDVEGLGVEARLRLFLPVCEAVHYAHQRLVVHRDLKPRNVLVSRDGRPKLLDFGIAKLLESVDAGVEATASAARILTPSYAAPEQFSGGRVTTATDVYGLGVLLYELLTGRRPWDWKGLSPPEILERWERSTPRPPSIAVARGQSPRAGTDDPRARPTPLGERRCGPRGAGLSRRLAGDLDTIVLRALRFEPTERYRSVDELAEDVRRHLDRRPVRARPATRWYRLGKFLRRHAAAVTWGSLAAILLLTLAVVSTVQSARLARERNVAREQRAQAERERDRAETVRQFMIDAFEAADPAAGGDGGATAREVVERAVRRLEIDLAGEPETQSALEHSFGSLYLSLGMLAEAESVLERALLRRESLFGRRTAVAAETLAELAGVRGARGDLAAAEQSAREALTIRRSVLGSRHPAVARSLRQLALILADSARLEEAEATAREALALHREHYGDAHRDVALDLNVLTQILFERGQMGAAEETARAAVRLSRRVFPDASAPIADDLNNLGAVVWTLGRYEEAEALFAEALEMHRRRLGEDHPTVASDLNNLGNLRLEVGDTEGAEERLRQALSILDTSLGEDHPVRARVLGNLGLVQMAAGRLEEAEVAFREALRVHLRHFGERHPDSASDLQHLGSALFLMGRHVEAAHELERALTVRRALFGEDAVATAESWMVLARLARESGRLEEAIGRYRRVLEIFRRAKGDDHWLVGLAALRLAETLTVQGRLGEARILADRGTAIYAAALPPSHWRIGEARGIVGALLTEEGRYVQARRELEASLEAMREAKGEASVEVVAVRRRLAELTRLEARRTSSALPEGRLEHGAEAEEGDDHREDPADDRNEAQRDVEQQTEGEGGEGLPARRLRRAEEEGAEAETDDDLRQPEQGDDQQGGDDRGAEEADEQHRERQVPEL